MLELFVYCIGVMYSPGPVNLLALNMGVSGRHHQSIPFFAGVGCAMFFLFMLFGITGEKFINRESMVFVGLAGCTYILYLAWRIYFARPNIRGTASVTIDTRGKVSLFRDGFLMQILNPKGIVATLPVGVIYIPTLELSYAGIFAISGLLALLAMWAPGSYSLLGHFGGATIQSPKYFLIFNKLLATMLAWTAVSIGFDVFNLF